MVLLCLRFLLVYAQRGGFLVRSAAAYQLKAFLIQEFRVSIQVCYRSFADFVVVICPAGTIAALALVNILRFAAVGRVLIFLFIVFFLVLVFLFFFFVFLFFFLTLGAFFALRRLCVRRRNVRCNGHQRLFAAFLQSRRNRCYHFILYCVNINGFILATTQKRQPAAIKHKEIYARAHAGQHRHQQKQLLFPALLLAFGLIILLLFLFFLFRFFFLSHSTYRLLLYFEI